MSMPSTKTLLKPECDSEKCNLLAYTPSDCLFEDNKFVSPYYFQGLHVKSTTGRFCS